MRHRNGGTRRERGAVLVEAALVFPVLFLVIFGIVEYALQFKDSLTLANAARAGVRSATIQPRQSTYLSAAEQAVVNGLGAVNKGDLVNAQIWIYKANPANGYPVASGDTDLGGFPSTGCTEYCAMFTTTDGTTWTCTAGCKTTTDFTPTGWVATGAHDAQYACTTDPGSAAYNPEPDGTRTGDATTDSAHGGTNDSLAGPDAIGVYIKITHHNITNMFGASVTLTDHAVGRLEPAVVSGSACYGP